MTNYFSKEHRGFTAVELMIVILIIVGLASISVLFLNNSRAKARDAKRMVDVRRIQTALEFYNLESDSYPITSQAISLGNEPFSKLCDNASGSFVAVQAECKTVYMSPLPSEPFLKGYSYFGAQNGYAIQFKLEKDSTFGKAGTYYAHSKNVDQSSDIK